MLADDLAGVFAKGVVVTLKAYDRNQTFDEEAIELDETAVFGDAQDHGIEIFAQATLHEFDFFPLDQLALRVTGASFGLTRFIRDAGQFRFAQRTIVRRVFGVAGRGGQYAFAARPRDKHGFEDAVDDEVGIAA